MLAGAPLVLLRRRFVWSRPVLRVAIRLMQAAPVYVIMFFMLQLFPKDAHFLGMPVRLSALTAVIVSQAVNMVAYMAENGHQALEHLDRNERAQALLFFPNVLRGFLIVVMSSGIGAAIGVSEAVGVTLKQAERLATLGEKVMLFLVVIAFFATLFSAANALTRYLMQRMLARSRAG
jgi:ABC-type amino acid transport system permease subunit